MNGSTIISIENYDVLLEPPVNGQYGQYQLELYQGHVGNKRLEVFLNLHQQAYQEARQRNDTSELDSIVDKITSLPGRFLWNSKSDTTAPVWQSLSTDQVRAFLHAILQQHLSQQQQQQLQPQSSYSPKHNLLQQEQQQQQQQQQCSNNSSATSSLFNIPSQRGVSPNNNGHGLSPIRKDDPQKRRRRSSLLRRSASESMLVDSKKKLFRMGMETGGDCHRRQTKEEPTWSSCRNINKHGLILTLNRMDVILTSSRNALDPNSQSPGNNRLHVLVAMRSGKYQQATMDGREAVLDEVIETVNTFWNGRFLTESDEGYELIDKEEARNALRSIFEMRSSQNLFSTGRGSADAAAVVVPDQNLVPDSLHVVGSGRLAPLGPGLISRSPRIGLLKQSSTGMIPQLPSTITQNANAALARQVSASVLPSEPILNMKDVGDLRSAAVRSLQKQKERQRVANRLEKGSSSVRNHNMGVTAPTTFMELDTISKTRSELNGSHQTNSSNNDNDAGRLPSFSSSAKKRQSTIFGALDPSLMEELTSDLDDD
ncbi:hypothetical protein IV203_036791 [Nitzschia inconspicua]|uniref:DUF6824 domain-containing protein n=1 Tax=Nitzschia inconspicua TaxID=303405 RepID=A0A9K3PW38_9STRA|nr:hypothetical protein IV203_036791 [Nitzschia inconspicua]